MMRRFHLLLAACSFLSLLASSARAEPPMPLQGLREAATIAFVTEYINSHK